MRIENVIFNKQPSTYVPIEKNTNIGDHYIGIFCRIYGGGFVLSVPMLRNIFLKDFEEFFKNYNVHNRTVRMKADTTLVRYSKVRDIINEELQAPNLKFTLDELDSFLFDELFYANKDCQYAYRFNNLFFTSETTEEQAVKFLSDIKEINFNKNLANDFENVPYNLYTTRIETIQGKLSSIKFLIKVSNINTRSIPEIQMFAAVMIDLTTNLVIFKFNQNQIENAKKEPLKILSELKELVTGLGIKGKVYEKLDLSLVSINESQSRTAIFEMFEELSLDAENILNSHTKHDTEDNITKFLTSMGLKHITKDYVQQIKAVIFQEISNTINDSTFEKGWVFKFLFKEGMTTRASSRTEDFSPIYGSKIYWHLKELIFKERKMIEGGFHWYLPNSSDDNNFVLVRIVSKNDTILLHYYYKMRTKRKEKENFVLQKINKYLP